MAPLRADSSAHEPLINDDARLPLSDESDAESELGGDDDLDETKLVSPGKFIWALTFSAGVSGLLFGYE